MKPNIFPLSFDATTLRKQLAEIEKQLLDISSVQEEKELLEALYHITEMYVVSVQQEMGVQQCL